MFTPPPRKRPAGPALALGGRPLPPTGPAPTGDGRSQSAPSFAPPTRTRAALKLPKLGPIRPGAYRSSSDDSTPNDEVPPWETSLAAVEEGDRAAVQRRVTELQGAVAGLNIGAPVAGPSSASTSSSSSRTSLPLDGTPAASPSIGMPMPRSASSSSSGSGLVPPAPPSAEHRITAADLDDLGRLGEGSAGEVRKVRLRSTGEILAKKTVSTSPDPAVHKQILRELSFLRECHAPFIVKYYGAFLEEERGPSSRAELTLRRATRRLRS